MIRASSGEITFFVIATLVIAALSILSVRKIRRALIAWYYGTVFGSRLANSLYQSHETVYVRDSAGNIKLDDFGVPVTKREKLDRPRGLMAFVDRTKRIWRWLPIVLGILFGLSLLWQAAIGFEEDFTPRN